MIGALRIERNQNNVHDFLLNREGRKGRKGRKDFEETKSEIYLSPPSFFAHFACFAVI
jgi:hypothetical protein